MEIWKEIIGYEGLYEISNTGLVKSITRNIILKPRISNGYFRLGLTDKYGKRPHFLVHRLVGLHFIHNPNNYPIINHLDGNKLNNDVTNLEWTTYQGNTRHSFKTGLRKKHHSNYKLSEEQVIEIRSLDGKMTLEKIGELYSIHKGMVSRIINRKKWKHI